MGADAYPKVHVFFSSFISYSDERFHLFLPCISKVVAHQGNFSKMIT